MSFFINYRSTIVAPSNVRFGDISDGTPNTIVIGERG